VWDRELSRPAALKLLHGHAPEDRARFLREARVAAKLSHPGIVPVFDAGEIDGEPFIVMEYVEGVGADEAGLDARGAADIVRQAAEAVEHAHRHGVIHRDLKPQNIIVGRGRAWVTDFGLAKSLSGDSSLSMTGDIMGTPSYMAPEQARGEIRAIGPHTDVFGLGALLYRLVAGRPPFEGANAYEVLRKVIKTRASYRAFVKRIRRRRGATASWRPYACARWRRSRRGGTDRPSCWRAT
jgi:serine/threonine-protein kinase